MKILIIKTSSMGDVIHTLPALTDAGKALPHIQFDWVVEEGFKDIPTWHPLVNQVIPIALRRWRKNLIAMFRSNQWKTFCKQIRATEYDFIIDAQGLVKSAWLTRLAKGVACGYNRVSAREPLASLFYQRRFNIDKEEHAVTRIRQLFATVLGYEVPETQPDYSVDLSAIPIDIEKPVSPYVMFIHGTSREDKCWSEAKWVQLGLQANKEGKKVLLPWGNEAECARAERIANQCADALVLPKLRLHQLALLLSQAKGAVAVDTGLGHLAAALNVPTVSLYGPTCPHKIGAIGQGQIHMKMSQASSDSILEAIAHV